MHECQASVCSRLGLCEDYLLLSKLLTLLLYQVSAAAGRVARDGIVSVLVALPQDRQPLVRYATQHHSPLLPRCESACSSPGGSSAQSGGQDACAGPHQLAVQRQTEKLQAPLGARGTRFRCKHAWLLRGKLPLAPAWADNPVRCAGCSPLRTACTSAAQQQWPPCRMVHGVGHPTLGMRCASSCSQVQLSSYAASPVSEPFCMQAESRVYVALSLSHSPAACTAALAPLRMRVTMR